MDTMLEIIVKIKDLYEHLKTKLEALNARDLDLNRRQEVIESGERDLSARQTDFNAREQAVVGIEWGLKEKAALDQERQDIAAARTALAGERQDFDTYKQAENGKLVEAKKALDNSWKELNDAKAKNDAEVNARVQAIMAQIKK